MPQTLVLRLCSSLSQLVPLAALPSIQALLAVLSPLASGTAVVDDPVLQRGLRHSADGRSLLEAAVATTNLMTSGRGPLLAPSWTAAGANQAVPVYLVDSPPGAYSTPAAVPRGCTCVFVNASALQAWLKVHSTGLGRFELEPRYILTFMLMHEVGHLTKRTAGADFANGELMPFNIDPSLAKASEEDADEFAAGLVREWTRVTTVSPASIEANWLAIELSKLSWNMQAYRSLDEFGALATGKPSVFFDQGLSHPNLAWRILRSNHLIQQSAEAKSLLDAFEAARERGASTQPLYKRP